jgi:hypothetical protein
MNIIKEKDYFLLVTKTFSLYYIHTLTLARGHSTQWQN